MAAPAVQSEAEKIHVNSRESEDEEEAAPQEEDDSDTEEPKEPRIRETPEDLIFEATVNTVAFHPNRDLIAAGDLDGDVYVVSYSCVEGGNQELWSSGHHLKSCRKLDFSSDGQQLFTVSKDKSIHIHNVEGGKLVTRIPKAHSAAINSLLLIDENMFATGDDVGMLKVWDLRRGSSFMEMKNHHDYITDITIDSDKKILVTTSGDGTMCAFNIKQRRFIVQSECQEADLTSVALMKYGTKVACSSNQGLIYLFNWDGFGATSDRFAMRGESIDCIIPITENILCAACMDGVIRAVNILPNRVIGSVGQHPGESIEQIAKSHEENFLASCAHDQKVKFWDISDLHDMVVSDYRKRKKRGQLKSLSKKAFGSGQDFFSDLVEKEAEVDKAEPEEAKSDSDSD
ncbi:WD repeat-containing protein 55 [Callorhinchus milii]|uniref:WD repeat-containing protein 55 n=1 Tax=Callorhinchus milii TaxID=7868 RepID=A0A4W3JH69_CALMI|nr:WD repeat-containing protein 55 [Callorhinchus milii]|eukprot:gi/632966028/ref/XP_007899191.1/ PREDICTED: WD repeat-containing protein 55 [Callorhinchus milii]